MQKNPSPPLPCETEVNKYLEKWDTLENYSLQEKTLDKLFFSLSPHNTAIDDILIKTSCLNDFYSTNVFSIFTVAKHILSIKDFDERLNSGDLSLVSEIANVPDLGRSFYSFASKYCSHHRPLFFPIFDSYVEKTLFFFIHKKSIHHLGEVGKGEFGKHIRNYETFVDVIFTFRTAYGLEKYSIKEIDQYLWLLGKEYFSKKYEKKIAKCLMAWKGRMKIYSYKNNIYDAVDAVIEHGVAAIEGTKTQAIEYGNRIIKCLEPYSDIAPSIGYQNVSNNGYLYYVWDLNKHQIGSQKLKDIVNHIDDVNAK
ncbi:MAG: hypothetical protein A2020_11445 [Lentisphaerae bacterium GWF2_45_14]|nr:MAG: hypothetical protein A2020_11445 [Lentisphaerae bacterium GWF2_45_14]